MKSARSQPSLAGKSEMMTKLPRIRFSLRTLLLGVTIIAVLLGGWRTWRDYHDRIRFERELSQLKVGFLQWPLTGRGLGCDVRPKGHSGTYLRDGPNGERIDFVPYYRRAYWYCVYLTLDGASEPPGCGKVTAVRVYRLRIPSPDYRAQTEEARKYVAREGWDSGERPLQGEEARRVACMLDFHEVLMGRAQTDLGIRYELVHEDPQSALPQPVVPTPLTSKN